MKKIIVALVLLASAMSMSAQGAELKKKGDPIRQKLAWQAPAAPSNEDGEIEAIYLAYNTPDGQEHQLVCELPWPIMADQFVGGDIEEEDVNFDGIPDLQVSIGFTDSTGHNAIYSWFVWDKKKQEFMEVDDPAIVSPSIDKVRKIITIRNVMDDTITYESYRWDKGKLVKFEEWTEDLKSFYGE